MANDIDDNHDADEPPMIPAFLANMTDEERKTFVARFNSAKVTSIEPLGEHGAIVEFTGHETSSFVALDVRPYLDNNEGKVSR